MKRISSLLIVFLTTLFCLPASAQTAPQAFKYQAVMRDSTGSPIANQNLGIRVSILADSTSGTEVYQETHVATSNQFGLISLEIGGGAVLVGVFGSIDWSAGDHFVKVEIDQTGGTSYLPLSIAKLSSVPYALYAENAATSFFYNDTNQVVHSNGDFTNISNTDFVFGSQQLDDAGNSNHDQRFFFDKSKGAFRAGDVKDDKWDDANVGDFSVAFGKDTRAAGKASFALGRNALADGDYSFAAGDDVTASGNFFSGNGRRGRSN
jgi:hypothetical protein